jgi:hypothetical protein
VGVKKRKGGIDEHHGQTHDLAILGRVVPVRGVVGDGGGDEMTTPARDRLATLKDTETKAADERDSILRDVHELRKDEARNKREIEWLLGVAGAYLTVGSAMNNARMKRE